MTERIQVPLYSLADCCKQFAQITGGQIIKHEDYETIIVPGNFFYTKHFIYHATEENLDSIMKEIFQGAPLAISYTAERVPARIADILTDHGYINPINQIGMIYDIPADYSYQPDEKVQIVEPSRYLEYSDTITNGFGKPRDDQYCEYMTRYENAHCYAYIENNKIMGTATGLKGSDFPGVHEVAVLPDARNHGACTHMLQRLIGDLKEEGYKQLSLQASAMGQPVYAALGFEAVSHIPTWLPAGPGPV